MENLRLLEAPADGVQIAFVQGGLKPGAKTDHLVSLDRLEEKVSSVTVPLAFSDELYQFRLHIDLLRNKLQKARDSEIDNP